MSKIEDWNREQKEYQNALRSVIPRSKNKPQKRGEYGPYKPSPKREYMTSETLSTTFRYRMTTAATLLKFFQANNERPQNVSQILRLAIETLETMAVDNDPSCKFDSDQSAFSFLQAAGIFIDTSAVNTKRIANKMRLEAVFGTNRPGTERSATPDGSTPDEVMIETFKHLEERQKLIQQISGETKTNKSSETERLEENRQMALSRVVEPAPVIDLDKPVGSAVETPEEAATRRENELKAEKLAMLQMIQNASRRESRDGSENG